MKTFQGLVGALVVAALAVSNAAAQELLTNGNMDVTSISSQFLATPTGWAITTNLGGTPPDAASSEPWNNVAAPGGSGLFVKTFQGTANAPMDIQVRQDVTGASAVPGAKYLLTGYVASGSGYSGENTSLATTQSISLEFLQGTTSLAVVTTPITAADLASTGVPGSWNDYRQYMAMGTAPAGTNRVRARFNMNGAYPGPQGGDAALSIDNFSLRMVPEPASMVLVGLSACGLFVIRRKK